MTYLVLAAAILIVHAADVIYSAWAIEKYGVSEFNPLVEWMSNDEDGYMVGKWLVLTTAGMGLILWGLYALRCPAGALGFGLAARVFVMIRNVNIVRRAK
jgi:hypothetical protein